MLRYKPHRRQLQLSGLPALLLLRGEGAPLGGQLLHLLGGILDGGALAAVDGALDVLGVAGQGSLVLGLPLLLQLVVVLALLGRLLSVRLLDGVGLGSPGLAGFGDRLRDVSRAGVVLREVLLVVQHKAGQGSLGLRVLLQLRACELLHLRLLRRSSLLRGSTRLLRSARLLRSCLLLRCSSLLRGACGRSRSLKDRAAGREEPRLKGPGRSSQHRDAWETEQR